MKTPAQPSPTLLSCTCVYKAPTVPTYRDAKTHLPECELFGSGLPVGARNISAQVLTTPTTTKRAASADPEEQKP